MNLIICQRIARLKPKCRRLEFFAITRVANRAGIQLLFARKRFKGHHKMRLFFVGISHMEINMLCRRAMATLTINTIYQGILIVIYGGFHQRLLWYLMYVRTVALHTPRYNGPAKVNAVGRVTGAVCPIMYSVKVRYGQLKKLTALPIQISFGLYTAKCDIKAVCLYGFAVNIANLVQAAIALFHYQFLVVRIAHYVLPVQKTTVNIVCR